MLRRALNINIHHCWRCVCASAGINATHLLGYLFFLEKKSGSQQDCLPASMSSDFLYVNKTRKPLHTQMEIKGLEHQEGREGAIKEGETDI